MSESWWAVVLLGVISLCVVVMTVTLVVVACDLRRTLKRLNAMLSTCDQAVHKAHRMLGQVQHLLTRTHRATRHVNAVIHKACDAASEAIERVVFLKEKAQAFLAGRFGNGARLGPRQHHRG